MTISSTAYMLKVVLAGQYPAGTYEKLRAMLPPEQFELRAVDKQQDYDAMTDAEIMILRIFKAPKEVIDRNPNLKIILRWGAGFDSVDIQTAGCLGLAQKQKELVRLQEGFSL